MGDLVRLGLPDSLYVRIRELGFRGYTGTGNNYTFLIPINGVAGDIIYYEAANSVLNQCIRWTTPQALHTFTVELRDRNGVVDLNGEDWSLDLQLFY